MNILSRLFSQPLMIEANAWDAFIMRAGSEPRPAQLPARTCSCDPDKVPDPPSRVARVLQLMRLATDVPAVASALSADQPALPNDTAVITIEGMIVKHADEWDCVYLGLTDLDDVDAALALVANNANIRNVLLNFVNCPGGTIIGIPETAARIAQLARTKNVKSFSDSQCCSGGIYLATQGSEFFVTESTYSGSIGVIQAPIMDYSKMLAAQGVSATIIKSGKFKDTGTPLRPITPEEVDMLQARSARIMKLFTSAVKSGRPGMSAANMEAQVFFGAEAVEVGLADAVVADLNAALAAF